MTTTLDEETQSVFAAGGALESVMIERGLKYRRQEAQAEYARRVALTLSSMPKLDSTITLLEGETGIGKGLGYLIPLCLQLAKTRERGLISTHTRLLQSQILENDLPIATEIAERRFQKRLKGALRLGVRNFISANRVAALRALLSESFLLDDETKRILTDLEKYSQSEGILREWAQLNGPLPPNIPEEAICLLSSNGADASCYKSHLTMSADADIVIVTHALLVRSLLRWHSVLGRGDGETPPFAAGIIDEADQFRDAAAEILSTRVSIPMLDRAVQLAESNGTRGLRKSVTRATLWLNTALERASSLGIVRSGNSGTYVNLAAREAKDLRSEAAEIARHLSTALQRLDINEFADEDAAEIMHLAGGLTDFAGSCETMADTAPVLRWSRVRGYAGFTVVPLHPGQLASRLWSSRNGFQPYLKSLVITSATLDAPGEGEHAFRSFKAEIGLFGETAINELSGRFSPAKFGSAKFVFADPRAPCPSADRREESETDPLWISYAATGLKEIANRGGRALVLTTSFRDAAQLCIASRMIGVSSLIEHRRGERVGGLLQTLRGTENGILVTPSAWEGVNLPGVLSHVVATRLPFPPPDDVERAALSDILIARGWAPTDAQRSIFRSVMYVAMRRYKQGFGRGIRAFDDSFVFWCFDPRLPLPDDVAQRYKIVQPSWTRKYRNFLACFPSRFVGGIRGTLHEAEILIYRPNILDCSS